MSEINPEDIVGKECRFVTYCPPKKGAFDSSDLHVIKEQLHLKDGRVVPNVRYIKNYKRPFWVTKKGCRNHQQKKEWEDISKLDRFESTQADLAFTINRLMGGKQSYGDLKKACRSPYVYGADILSTAIIKQTYMDKYPDRNTFFSMAAFDIETDVLYGTDGIMMATLSYKDKVVTAVRKIFVEGQTNVEERLQKLLIKYIGPVVERRGIKWEVVLVDSELDVIKTCFDRAHQWMPDFVAIWNIDFDLPKMLTALEGTGVDPAQIFSDPSIPEEFRYFKYKRGPEQKVTASGKITPIKPAARWHTAYCPASFYFIDAMCVYRHVRTGSQEEPSYALDAILKKHKLGGKLKFEEADGLSGLEWHQFMQQNYPLEYIIYNVWDCISMEELDEKIKDLSLSMPQMSGCSDFEKFNSQPRRLVDNLHFVVLKEHNRVIGTTSDEMKDEFDDATIGLNDWIVTLPAELVANNGLCIIEENPNLRTNLRVAVADLDVAGAYPNNGAVFNTSRETTHRELCKIKGVSERQRRLQGINLSGGPTNAIEVCTGLLNLPSLEKLRNGFIRDLSSL